MAVTTHVLDTAMGRPAAGVPVRLERVMGIAVPSAEMANASTDADGRANMLGPADILPGTYRLIFDTAAYYRAQLPGATPFFPEVTVTFTVQDQNRNYHVPVLLSPFGYCTYRGS
jgi:5-hydroxyisourate hydrolase